MLADRMKMRSPGVPESITQGLTLPSKQDLNNGPRLRAGLFRSGIFQTSESTQLTSAFGGKADIANSHRDVR
jgi:hypothetical protein